MCAAATCRARRSPSARRPTRSALSCFRLERLRTSSSAEQLSAPWVYVDGCVYVDVCVCVQTAKYNGTAVVNGTLSNEFDWNEASAAWRVVSPLL